MALTLVMHGNLKELLPRELAAAAAIVYPLDRRASVKDVIEVLGVPHPEVARLTVNGREKSFGHIVQDHERVEVWPLVPVFDVTVPSVLRPVPFSGISFVVDVNVGKLAPLLRMAGFDTRYGKDLSDAALAEIAAREQRILLTRDRRLLRRRLIEFGHLVRELAPPRQLAEVISLFGLAGKINPFTRCLCCNGLLEPVAKKDILARLLPLTRKYYNDFHLCRTCDKVYWPGSHRAGMEEYLAGLAREEAGPD